MAFLCVDIGATNTLLGTGKESFETVEKFDTEEFLNDIENVVNSVLEQCEISVEELESVSVAAAGPIDREKGTFYPPNIRDENIQIVEPLEQFGEVRFINDCTSAVIGEYYYGDHDVENLVYVTISSGIGSGAVVDGELVEGWNGNVGEVGHIQLCDSNLGNNGGNHWESICSGNHLPGFAENLTGQKFEDAREIFDLYEERDCDAKHVIEEMKEFNARGFAALVNLFNPEKIVVGGAVALNHAEKVVDPLQDHVEDKVVNRVPDIETCSLGERSVLHGLRAASNGDFTP